jgi:hypothetical protein
MNVPTDRLFKFLTLGGIAAAIFGVTTAISKHDEYGRQMIEAKSKYSAVVESYSEYRRRVEEIWKLAERLNNSQSTSSSSIPNDSIRREVIAKYELAEKEFQEARKLMLAAQVEIDRWAHQRQMLNVWYLVCGFTLVVGVLAAYVGFEEWKKQPSEAR